MDCSMGVWQPSGSSRRAHCIQPFTCGLWFHLILVGVHDELHLPLELVVDAQLVVDDDRAQILNACAAQQTGKWHKLQVVREAYFVVHEGTAELDCILRCTCL